MSDNTLSPRVIIVVAMVLMMGMFVAYMIFLVSTWQQLQTDRSTALSKIDNVLDRIPKGTVNDAAGTASAAD